ncbi:hypothetical protein ABID42_002556 [Arcicella rosea]|uniref:carboxypeptidase-like regulatory domain-containing protein n=1 Tax=Arcicella rosea TaxID=502909 RepID=UPI00345CDC11
MKKEKEEQKRLFHQWYLFALSSSGFIVIIYIFLHIIFEGKEIKALSPEQFTSINAIISKTDSESAINKKTAVKIGIKDYLKVSLLVGLNEDEEASKVIDSLVDKNSLEYLVLVLPSYPFEVRSFFWMKGFKAYAELFFWIWFGVLSSVLYTVVNAHNVGKFSSKLIYDHIAKLFYAPPVSFILYFSSNLLISQNLISLDKISNNSIVFVFILGFFSGRAIELLNRLKDVIIPLNGVQNTNNQAEVLTEEIANLSGNIIIGDNTLKELSLENCEVKLTNKNIVSNIYTTKTDKEGFFEFTNIPVGLYQISADLLDDKGFNMGMKQHLVIEKASDFENKPLHLVLNKQP